MTSHPAVPVLQAALERKGMMLGQAEAAAGFRQGEVARWLSGRRGGQDGIFQDHLQRLVDVLEEPELLNVILWRWRRWTLTCTRCGASMEYEPGQFRAQRKRGFHQEAVIDEAAGSGRYICLRCKQVEVGKRSPIMEEITRTRKRKGKAGLRDNLPILTPQQRKEYRERAWAANRGRPRGPEERWRHAVGLIRPRPVGRWGICRNRTCSYIAFSSKVYRPVLMHHACQDEYRRQHQRQFGGVPHPPRPEGQHLSPEKLADAFELSVRTLLRGDSILQPDEARTKPGDIVPGDFGLGSKRAVELRIDAFLDRLPPDDRGGERLALWARALREAREKRPRRRRRL